MSVHACSYTPPVGTDTGATGGVYRCTPSTFLTHVRANLVPVSFLVTLLEHMVHPCHDSKDDALIGPSSEPG
jgi:hypothetical protein